MKKWKLNECQLIPIKQAPKKFETMEQKHEKKKHEGATATVFTEDTLGY